MKSVIELAKENCPYHSEEMRGAYYDGFVRAAALVRAEREWVDLTDDELFKTYMRGGKGVVGLHAVIAAWKAKNGIN